MLMYAKGHLIGEKNGKKSGMKLNIVLLNAKKQKNSKNTFRYWVCKY